MLRQIGAIFIKDIQTELRSREILSGMLMFAILCMFIFSFSVDTAGDWKQDAAASVLWATIILSGTLGILRTMTRETETAALEGLLMVVDDRSAIVFGKALGMYLFMLMTGLLLLLVGSLLFNVNLMHFGIVVTLLLGTSGYALAGILVSCMAARARSREILLSVLLLPLSIPLLFGCVSATRGFLNGTTWTESSASLGLIVVYDLIMIVLALVMSEYVFDA